MYEWYDCRAVCLNYVVKVMVLYVEVPGVGEQLCYTYESQSRY